VQGDTTCTEFEQSTVRETLPGVLECIARREVMSAGKASGFIELGCRFFLSSP
jgi:hypothetical protein